MRCSERMSQKILVVIPSRYRSERLPGKPLKVLAGRSLWEWAYRAAVRAGVGRVVVATEDARIARDVRRKGAEVLLTSPRHPSGSDRVWEVSRRMRADIVVNLQGDEPLMNPRTIRKTVSLLLKNSEVLMGTAAAPLESESERNNPHVVKVVLDKNGRALYFSRSPLPTSWKHLGIYAYRSGFLSKFHRLPVGFLEKQEKLEQLRALENGFPVWVARVNQKSCGVDTPEDLRIAEGLLLRHRYA